MEQSKQQIFYTRLADANLILGHRLSEWCGHGPELEQDIALINVALDLIGQSRSIYAEIGKLTNVSEDDVAYLRDADAFLNPLLCELPNGNFGDTILRQFFFDVYHYYLLQALQQSTDPFLVGYANKSIKEVTYHVKHSRSWVIRLGDGTEESHLKMEEALEKLWPYTEELFLSDEVEQAYVDLPAIKKQWIEAVGSVLEEATLFLPEPTWPQKGGKQGLHTEHLGFILADMQFLRRAYPQAKEW